jgi:preprotein translocase subunit SecG
MMGLIIAIHVIACALLITIILIQRGRGSGLVESFSGVESMFGTKTDAFLTRSTTVFSIVFFITCLSLAFLSAKQSRSLMKDVKVQEQTEKPAPTQTPQPKAPAEQPPAQQSEALAPAVQPTEQPQAAPQTQEAPKAE